MLESIPLIRIQSFSASCETVSFPSPSYDRLRGVIKRYEHNCADEVGGDSGSAGLEQPADAGSSDGGRDVFVPRERAGSPGVEAGSQGCESSFLPAGTAGGTGSRVGL